MIRRRSCLAFALGATALPASNALAALTSGTYAVDSMQIASGFLDLDDPSSSTFTDLNSIDLPPVASFLVMLGVVPETRSFFGSLDFTSAGSTTASFDLDFQATTVPFSTSDLELFFSGGRIELTSSVPFSVTLDALVGGSGGGLAFLYDYNVLEPNLLFPSGEPASLTLDLAAGSHTIAFGALVDSNGGNADLEGSLTFNFVPSPGAVALLAVAGLSASRRRRS
jgi:hypothetical protein